MRLGKSLVMEPMINASVTLRPVTGEQNQPYHPVKMQSSGIMATVRLQLIPGTPILERFVEWDVKNGNVRVDTIGAPYLRQQC